MNNIIVKAALLTILVSLTCGAPPGDNVEFERRLKKKQGKNCSLEASITCKLQGSETPCEMIEPFDVAQCNDNDGVDSYAVEYTVSYSNSNEDNGIRFKTTNKAGKELTFAKANGKPINIKRGRENRAGQSESFQVQRRIDRCNFDMLSYQASIRLEGYLVGKPKTKQNRCFARDFYKEPIVRLVIDLEPGPN
jgi:hypothetical protein